MLTALSTALSALNAQATAIDVVGNNLANLNTVGYKASSTEFFDLVSQTVGGPQTQIGMGVGTPITQRVFSQGNVQSTANSLDVAIQGSGFLVTQDPNGATLYTRAGDLKKDTYGNLTDANGNYIQGWTANNGVVSTSTPIGNITIPTGSLAAPIASTKLSLNANLNSNANAVAAASQTPANADLSQAIPVYDSLGNSHLVTLNFWKNGANSWNWAASLSAADTAAGATVAVTGSQNMSFNAAGTMTSPLSTAVPQIKITGLPGAATMNMNFNLYDSAGNPTITQYAQTSASASNNADGQPAGQLSDVAIGDGGVVIAKYSNGKQVTLGQLAMANFSNPDSLLAVGNNSYQTTGATSNPSIGLAGTGGRGQIQGSALESSTADIATEFTNLMVNQRSYEANSKVITTADTLNQDVINLIH